MTINLLPPTHSERQAGHNHITIGSNDGNILQANDALGVNYFTCNGVDNFMIFIFRKSRISINVKMIFFIFLK